MDIKEIIEFVMQSTVLLILLGLFLRALQSKDRG